MERLTHLKFAAIFVLVGSAAAIDSSAAQLPASYFKTTPATPLECACNEAITKVVIQEVNRTVMVPEFVPYDKHFARITKDVVKMPVFSESMEEIREVNYVEQQVPVMNVEYKWVEVKKRVPVFNRTTLQIDEYTLEPVNYSNQQVKMEPVVYMDTTIQEQEEEIDETIIEEKETVLRFEKIVYEDFKMEVEETVYQDVVEYVEQIEYKDTDVYVWQVELYDEELLQKDVQEKGSTPPQEVDEITIEKKTVKVPRLVYQTREVVVHEPVEIIQTPVADPEFYNRTYKVPIITKKSVPVPQYQDVPVEVPTYKRSTCALPRDPASFLPPTCSCDPCQPCTVCPTEQGSRRAQRGSNYTASTSTSTSRSSSSSSSSSGGSSGSRPNLGANLDASASANKYKRQSLFRPSPRIDIPDVERAVPRKSLYEQQQAAASQIYSRVQYFPSRH